MDKLISFPDEFSNFYVEALGEWWKDVNYSDMFYGNFMKLLLKEPKKDMIGIVFSSTKLGKNGNYALMYVPVAFYGNDAYIKGIRHIGDYFSPPRKGLFNEAYINMRSDEELLKYDYGKRLNIGVSDKMADVKEIIQAWIEGYINESGTTPDYRYVEYF